jgi:hypothetical protein
MPAERPPHPAKITQSKATVRAPARRPPHAALVAQPKPRSSTLIARPPHPATVVRVGAIQRMNAPLPEASNVSPQLQAPARALVFDSSLEKGDPVYQCRYIAPSPDAGIFVCGASDVAEMIAKLKRIGPGRIRFLTLCGHGAEGVLGMGSGVSSRYQVGKDISSKHLDDVAGALADLAQLLTGDALVLLVGCHVGAETSGHNLLRRLSKALPGRLILASEAYLQPVVQKGDSFTIHHAGVNNARQGDRVQRDQLVGARRGHFLESVFDVLSEEDFETLVDWPAGTKAKDH